MLTGTRVGLGVFLFVLFCRLQMDEELRQREREREREREKEREREADREREKEREREREREKELEREREKERERELERQRERAREKELSMVKAMEGPFLPMAELHGLRGHPAEERGKAAEPLVPGRAGNNPAVVGPSSLFPSPDGKAEGVGDRLERRGPARAVGWLCRLPARRASSPAAAARSAGPLRSAGAVGEAPRGLCRLTSPGHAKQLGWQRAGSPLQLPLPRTCGAAPQNARRGLACALPTPRLLFVPPPEKLKDSVLPTPKPIQHPLHPPPASHHPVPSLIPNHNVFPLPGSSAATALLIHRTNEEEKWLARQRRLRQEKEDRQSQVSEFRQQVLEQHLDMGRTPSQPEPEHRPENPR